MTSLGENRGTTFGDNVNTSVGVALQAVSPYVSVTLTSSANNKSNEELHSTPCLVGKIQPSAINIVNFCCVLSDSSALSIRVQRKLDLAFLLMGNAEIKY